MIVPQVSVIVPAYRRPALLDRTLASLARQTHRDFEVIVVDDASGDDTFAVARRWANRDARFHALRNDRNMGVGETRNAGLRAAAADWVAFVDSDDVVHPRYLEWQLAEARAAGGPCMVAGWYVEDRGDRRVLRRWRHEGNVYAPVLKRYDGCTSIFLFPRERVLGVGGFDCTMRNAEEVDLLLRLSPHLPMRVVKRPILMYDSRPRGDRLSLEPAGVRAFLERWSGEIRRLHGRRALASMQLYLGILELNRGRRTASLRALARSLRTWPLDHHAWRLGIRAARLRTAAPES